MPRLLLILMVSAGSVLMYAQNPLPPNQSAPRSDSESNSQQLPRSDSRTQQSQPDDEKSPGEDSATPVKPGESSSRDNIIDLSPPKGDDLKHLGSDEAMESSNSDDSEVSEFKPWNPHKAQKDIEVGDYYAKQKNYRAAISRYREALEYKPKDALATFKLAESLEKVMAYQEARENYESYLIILPRGPLADKAKQGIDRLKDKSKNRPRLNQDGTTAANPSAQSSQNPR
jgi:tetratricopeptide (TPR) repeat protein